MSPEVIGAGGDFFSSSSGSLAWTIGETMVETFQSSQGYLTQGFHQPSFVIVTDIMVNPEQTIFLFPNPTTRWLTLQIHQPGGYRIELYDLKGIRLVNTEVSIDESTHEHRIDMDDFAVALYLLRITELSSGKSYGFRIERI